MFLFKRYFMHTALSKYKSLFSYLPKPVKATIYRRAISVSEPLPAHIHLKLASTKDELTQAFRILHDAYVGCKLMQSHHSGMRVTPYHALPTTHTLIAVDTQSQMVLGTLSIVCDGVFGLPSDELINYKQLNRDKFSFAEISALAVRKELKGQLLLPLMKFMYETCVYLLNIDKIIAVLVANTRAPELYEAILFFNKLNEVTFTNYAFSNYLPVVAELLDLKVAYDTYRSQYNKAPKHRNLFNYFTELTLDNFKLPSHKSDIPIMDAELFSYFFCEVTSCLNEMPPERIAKLKELYRGFPHEKIINTSPLLQNENYSPPHRHCTQ